MCIGKEREGEKDDSDEILFLSLLYISLFLSTFCLHPFVVRILIKFYRVAIEEEEKG
jgi:hypothetical protein